MLVIVGLGNPGPAYARTRHNVGFRCVDHFAGMKGIRFARTACNARLAELQKGGTHVVLAKPRTFMNLSGQSAIGLVHSLGIPPERLLVVYDDVDLPLGRLRVRSSGGSGGHNGVRSITAALNTDRFPRVRVGIGRPAESNTVAWTEDSLIDYVLGRFSPEEEAVIQDSILKVGEVLDCIVTDGVEAAMNRFNSVV
ncbi:MAG: aminoacyl-tRNA hydrolase [Dehalococcoidia bacterium]|nr:MAG: aminoacyl-tRNA hydrolase [Dehalococcoidia bacterium]